MQKSLSLPNFRNHIFFSSAARTGAIDVGARLFATQQLLECAEQSVHVERVVGVRADAALDHVSAIAFHHTFATMTARRRLGAAHTGVTHAQLGQTLTIDGHLQAAVGLACGEGVVALVETLLAIAASVIARHTDAALALFALLARVAVVA